MTGQKKISVRARVLGLVARPPMPTGRSTDKKCWSRSFTLDVDTGRKRLLTTHVCEDRTYWLVGFRTVE